MSKYLARLKSEKRPDCVLPKLPKPPFDSKDSTEGEHISVNKPLQHLQETPTPLQQATYEQQFAAESGRRDDFCNTHRGMLGGFCDRFNVIEQMAPGDRMASLDACLLWQMVRVGQKIELAAGVEIVRGVTVGDVVSWVSVSAKDLESIRNERRLLLIVAETFQSCENNNCNKA
jgi:hypothetical protein